MGVLMTGMGNDGSVALGKIKEAGGFTVAQDEASCVVFGMPNEAIKLGNATEVQHLDCIAQRIVDFASGRVRKRAA